MVSLLGHTAMVLHFCFLCFVVFGGFLAWRRPRLFWVHLGVAAYALGIVVIDWPCLLTEVENWSRLETGRAVMEHGFIDFYLTGNLYPPEHLLTSRLVMAAVVAVSWAGAGWLRLRRRLPERARV
ncbi:hypothetical protein A6A08_18230 [Nocardiopsis sp. TSRI0078]|uniref:DUF2784 domain-containing protein n=1 Tax=unclassified Nocardiopsis TaxID=2649073 RepID=UPI00093A06AF|nr:DUF2784 domain-containing protein [Nocardiopsis sp. TSRI0078]OKI22891.1 hypothetical protein A6A08_18230 [Nocardiopsis sp. TSRI0078]